MPQNPDREPLTHTCKPSGRKCGGISQIKQNLLLPHNFVVHHARTHQRCCTRAKDTQATSHGAPVQIALLGRVCVRCNAPDKDHACKRRLNMAYLLTDLNTWENCSALSNTNNDENRERKGNQYLQHAQKRTCHPVKVRPALLVGIPRIRNAVQRLRKHLSCPTSQTWDLPRRAC